MATIQLLSDLHLEFLDPYGRKAFLEALDPSGVDILILAGDICLASQLEQVLTAFCAVYPQVVYVPGNHEFYGSTPSKVGGILWDVEVANKNLTKLNKRLVEVGDLTFIGDTLWFPKPNPKTLQAGKWQMNDYMKIGDFEPWVYEENALTEAMLNAFAAKADVVVTHHLPSKMFVAPQYRVPPYNTLNHYFCYDMTQLIETAQPPLWVFGHTHTRMWGHIGKTLLTCNPKGYPREKDLSAYVEKCLIQVEPGGGAKFLSDKPGGDTPVTA